MRLATVLLSLTLLEQPSVQELMQQGLAAVRAGDVASARALFESAVEQDPRFGPARVQLAQLAIERGDWEDAEAHLEVAVQSKLRRPGFAWFLLGRVRRALGEESARDALERAVALAPDFIRARRELAEVAVASGDFWVALEELRAIVATAPGESDYAVLANTARRVGAFDLARCAVIRAGETASTAYLRAVIEEQAGNVDEAIAAARRALELGLEDAAVYVTLGNLYHEKMRLSESIAAFERAVSLDSAAAESLASFALTSLTTKDYERLRRLLERHVESHPDSVNTLYSLGAMYLREEELEAAETVFERLKSLLPNAPQVHYNLAMLYRRQGRVETSRAALDRFRQLKRREDEEWERQNALHRTRLRLKEAPPEEGVKLGERLVTSGSAETEDFLLLADALYALGRREEAVHYTDLALEKDPYDREALLARQELAASLGDGETEAMMRHRVQLLSGECSP